MQKYRLRRIAIQQTCKKKKQTEPIGNLSEEDTFLQNQYELMLLFMEKLVSKSAYLRIQ